MTHIVLLGDSIFDNESYVPEGKDVVSHLRRKLDADSQVTLLAVDGAIVDDIESQVSRIPHDATHLMLSAGGNDALDNLGVLGEPTQTVMEYRGLVRSLVELQKPLVVCTIYEPPMFDELPQPVVATALAVFNDTILGIAFEENLSVIETRMLLNQASDFESIIEPSDSGGAKIAQALAMAVHIEIAPQGSQVFGIRQLDRA
jgi:hypothetical protein